jgi:hypothetical protein
MTSRRPECEDYRHDLLDGSRTAGGSVNLRLQFASVDDIDDEATGWLSRAYHANL